MYSAIVRAGQHGREALHGLLVDEGRDDAVAAGGELTRCRAGGETSAGQNCAPISSGGVSLENAALAAIIATGSSQVIRTLHILSTPARSRADLDALGQAAGDLIGASYVGAMTGMRRFDHCRSKIDLQLQAQGVGFETLIVEPAGAIARHQRWCGSCDGRPPPIPAARRSATPRRSRCRSHC